MYCCPHLPDFVAYCFQVYQECTAATDSYPYQLLQYQRPDLHGYSPFHKEIGSSVAPILLMNFSIYQGF